MPYGDNCFAPTGRTDPIGNLSCAIGEQEISPHIHSAGSVAVLGNVETTPVQLHATPFQNRDATGTNAEFRPKLRRHSGVI